VIGFIAPAVICYSGRRLLAYIVVESFRDCMKILITMGRGHEGFSSQKYMRFRALCDVRDEMCGFMITDAL
jgi:predicted metal-dependent hydrolase